MHSYYIEENGYKDGPHDLVTVMRRIRAKKINANTPIYVNEATDSLPAQEIAEIALFFDTTTPASITDASLTTTLSTVIAQGWQFVTEHHIMTVYAGGLLLLCLMLASGLINALGLITGSMAAGAILMLFHNLYLLFTLRLYRGQTLSSDFINQKLAPALPAIFAASLMLSLMVAGGLFLLIIPGVIVAVMYIFVPLLVLDRSYGVVEAMYASRLLLQKHGKRYVGRIFALVALHLVCLFLIIPIPITLPIFSAAISAIYEEMLG